MSSISTSTSSSRTRSELVVHVGPFFLVFSAVFFRFVFVLVFLFFFFRFLFCSVLFFWSLCRKSVLAVLLCIVP